MTVDIPKAPDDANRLRASFESALAEGRVGFALTQAERLWRTASTLATAGFIKSRAQPLVEALGFRAKRIAILRGFTVETMTPLLEVCSLLSRFSLDIRLGQYNAYVQELMDASSGAAQDADVVLVALHTRTAAPALWSANDPKEMQAAADWLCANLATALEAFRAASPAPVLLQILDTPAEDALDHAGQVRRELIAATNTRLRDIAAALPDCHAFDIAMLTDKPGQKWHDERNWKVAKVPFRTDRAPELATLWFKLMRPLLAAPCKVLVTDLDDTLWGGILGEDGAAHLRMGQDTGYRSIQDIMLRLKARGFLLAIASKNDEAAALPVLTSHLDCLIRPDDVVSMRINWSPKSENIRAMADELALGLDSFLFLDDNPVEQAQVAADLPMVRILPHLADPYATAQMLESHPELQRLTVTAEDAARTALYKARGARNAAAGSEPALREAFLSSLQQEILVEPLSDDAFVRLADLERKTNQFNLRTRRFSETALRGFAARPDAFVLAFRVLDRFGDNGIVGAAAVTLDGETAAIENLLMSCRVIGRNVEFAMLREIAQRAGERGCQRLVGSFSPTEKNSVARQFYAHAGFSAVSADGDIAYWQSAVNAAGLAAKGEQTS